VGLETTRLEASEHAPGDATVNVDALTGTVHFIGIGGIGMSALARLLLARGKQVSGSDKEANAITEELAGLGARIFIGHDAKNLDGAPVSLVVVSTAITDANPELKEARARGLQVMHRSDMLRALTERRKLLAVSGTHGKTTTTGMLAQVFIDSGLEPEVVVGGIFPRIGSNSYAGKGEYFIAEADESDRTHAKMHSYVSMITNIEMDHLENYPGGMAEICDNMVAFANGSSHACVVCVDDEGCKSILPRIKVPVVSYGSRAVSPNADYVYETAGATGGAAAFVVSRRGEKLGEVKMSVPGEHNKLNALGVIAVAMESGVPFDSAVRALESFGGVDRRFTLIGTKSGITVVDDYGHHPTEVRATLHAAREYARTHGMSRVVALFQPHQPGRLRDLWNEFCDSFAGADLVLLADVYVARGTAIEGITSERFATEVKGCDARYVGGSIAELPEKVAPLLKSGDLVLTIGAGDITKVGPELIKRLN
jgi:UDP-N-acetylmuramate--alanine ligase